MVPGVSSAATVTGERTNYEIAIPLRLLKHVRPGADSGLVLNLSFRAPGGLETELPEPQANTLAYRLCFGGDALLPVYFVELNLEQKTRSRGSL
jgi:hypothetical protein